MLEESGGLIFVDVNLILNSTSNPTAHKVTFAYSKKFKRVSVLGGIPHGCELVLNQKLIDDLQKILDIAEGKEKWKF